MRLVSVYFTILLLFSFIYAKSNMATIRFDQNKYNLTSKYKALIDKYISEIDTSSLSINSKKLIITGYIDFTPAEKNIDSLPYNRANSVANYIISKNLFFKDKIIVSSFDKEYYILPVTKEGRRLNRRVEIIYKSVEIKKSAPVPQKLSFTFVDTNSISYKTKNTKNDGVIFDGDNIIVKKNGFCRLNFADNYILDITSNSFVTFSKKGITLHSGVINLQKLGNDILAPITITSRDSKIVISGNGIIDQRDSLKLLVSLFSDECSITTKYGKKTAKKMQGIAASTKQKILALVDLPVTPIIKSQNDTITRLPGIAVKFTWDKSGAQYKYILTNISENDSLTLAYKTVDTTITKILDDGKWQVQVQSGDKYGFRSQWSDPQNIVVKRQFGVKWIKDFTDTSFNLSLKRPYTLKGEVYKGVKLFLDSTEIIIDSLNKFSLDLMLLDSLNNFNFRVIYPDSSTDDFMKSLYYTGADERVLMNDSVVGKNLFTISRHYKLHGYIPNGVALSINDENIKLGANGFFEKDFKLNHYGIYPIELLVKYKNGHEKVIILELERHRYNSFFDEELGGILLSGFVILTAVFMGILASNAIE